MSAPRAIVTLVLAALALRLALVPYQAAQPLVSDFLTYAADAERIARGEGSLDDPDLAKRAPVYPFVLACVFALFGRSLAAAYVLQALAWTAGGLAVWLWSRARLGEGGALSAAALFLFHPDGIVASAVTGVESLSAVLLAFLLLRMSRLCEKTGHAGVLILDGLLAGAAVLTVVPLLLFVVAGLVYVVWVRRRRGLAVGRLALVPAGIALIAAPWAIRNALATGEFVPLTTMSGTALLGGNNPEADGEWNEGYVQREHASSAPRSDREWNSHARQRVAEFVVHSPGRFLLLEAMKLAKFFSPKPPSFLRGRLLHPWLELVASPAFWMPMLILLPLGVFITHVPGEAGDRLASDRVSHLAVLAVASFLVTTLVFFAHVRYRITYLAPFSFLAVAGWLRLRVMFADRFAGRGGIVGGIVVWLGSLVAIWTWLLHEEWAKVLSWIA